ncbi:MAG: hypothetical protein B7Y15_10705 [Bacteroidetes bacterium 24-39-8]|jgi:hypothetical protein|nr:MAG: hypothetical protein B7Y69_13085 [Sphingobacteriia bacterium 35-40-8]OYZ49154.1 MAG: hypothetical protein B7Y15_10705 [Bacteroidetes bacterium 24-39-8]OZA62518.1 MAG: hypothetical protein B7X72_11760 [Sphingobacteriia bacterium 39-39-8]
MKGLLFLSRLAFICNGCFLACLVLQRTQDTIPSQGFKGLIIILGWFIAPFLGMVVNIWRANLLVKSQPSLVPKWLALTNLIFLIVQICYHFIFQ